MIELKASRNGMCMGSEINRPHGMIINISDNASYVVIELPYIHIRTANNDST